MSKNTLETSLNKASILQAKTEYSARTLNDTSKNMIYPWINHDYDYQQFVKNNYSPQKMGISSEPCIDVTIKDAIRLPNYLTASMFDAIPSKNSKAGVDDIDPNNTELLAIKNKSEPNFTMPTRFELSDEAMENKLK